MWYIIIIVVLEIPLHSIQLLFHVCKGNYIIIISLVYRGMSIYTQPYEPKKLFPFFVCYFFFIEMVCFSVIVSL